jgi:hypothetical protein
MKMDRLVAACMATIALVIMACNDSTLPTSPAAAPAAGGPSFAGSTLLPDIRGCFQWTSGAYYKTQPVFLQYWNGTQWVSSRQAKTGTTGCIQFNDISVNKYYRLQAYVLFGFPTCQAWLGRTPVRVTLVCRSYESERLPLAHRHRLRQPLFAGYPELLHS